MFEFDTAKIEKTMTEIIEGKRPPARVRDQVDLGFRLIKQSVEVFEVRSFRDEPKRRIECPIAKATFVKKQGIWKVYWFRASGRWDRYDPHRNAKTLEEFLDVVKKDELGCFFG